MKLNLHTAILVNPEVFTGFSDDKCRLRSRDIRNGGDDGCPKNLVCFYRFYLARKAKLALATRRLQAGAVQS
ncbi:hypothetical protein D3C80_1798600 [compost metagenome]